MSIGNHELDYGIAHLMFASRYADFPIINANFRMRKNNRTMFKPYTKLEMGDLRVLVIGLITKDIVDQTKAEGLVGTYVTVNDPVDEVREVIEQVRAGDSVPDITVLMTHIGHDSDVKLAKALDPSLGVKLIIGAHSHTYWMDIDEKYGTIITRLKRDLDNYGRGNTTEVGQLFVDAFTDSLDVDVMMMLSEF